MRTKRTYITAGERERLLAIVKKYGLDDEPKNRPQYHHKVQIDEKAKAEWRSYAAQSE